MKHWTKLKVSCREQHTEGVRIKIKLCHIFIKNELRVFLIGKPDYASFGYVTIPLHSLVTSNLRHLDVVSAKRG